MSFKESVSKCLFEKYLAFSGYASLAEYRRFAVFRFVALIVATWLIIGGAYLIINPSSVNPNHASTSLIPGLLLLVLVLLDLALLPPLLSVSARLLHQQGHSGLWAFVNLIPTGSVFFFLISWLLSPIDEASQETLLPS